MHRLARFLLVLVPALALSTESHAGLGDKLKKKVQDKAAAKVEEKVDPEAAEAAETEGAAGDPAGAEGDVEKVSDVSTKFDFVPGDKVLFADDFTEDELGEFPANWRLKEGTFEVAEMKGQRWLRSTSITSDIRMKLPSMAALPEFWTLELDFYCGEPSGNVLTVSGMSGDQMVWNVVFPYSSTHCAFTTGDVFSNTPLEGPSVWGRVHHVMFMARGKAIKTYIDCQRVANIPEINPAPGAPNDISIYLWSDKQPMITNVRFAEGCRPPKDMLAEGKLVTYGIHFASGSDVVLPESAPVLRQVAAYMEANAAVKLGITGHTDSAGKPDYNLDLSKRRAASVAKVLSEQFGIAADRFATDGLGDTQAVASNDKPEGRAMNRRVEFAKL
jgi:outer membrane protein OmpA-like peptidoglycan-associated protein